ncbi:MAG TPA: NYN domain-containing protein [Candidatus Saccharibacteria bacterium]|nr:NYN domain-containing protein [Candidatus Saccharibacteria bacterium]
MSHAKNEKTYAFIDSQNLNLGVKNDVINAKGKVIYRGKQLDYRKFRHYLREKYNVSQAYIFIGMVPTNNSLYTYLQRCGFTLVFKTISTYMDERGQTITKGNVDTDIVLWSAGKLEMEYDAAVFVSGDGDFLSLYEYMDELGKLKKIIVPNRMRYSKLLNSFRDRLAFVGDVPKLLNEIQTNKKTRSSGRITSLGQPGRGDTKNIAKKTKKVNRKRKGKP